MNIKMFLRRKFDTDFDCVIRLFEHNEKFKFQTHLLPSTLDWLFAAKSLAFWTFPYQTEKNTAIIIGRTEETKHDRAESAAHLTDILVLCKTTTLID